MNDSLKHPVIKSPPEARQSAGSGFSSSQDEYKLDYAAKANNIAMTDDEQNRPKRTIDTYNQKQDHIQVD